MNNTKCLLTIQFENPILLMLKCKINDREKHVKQITEKKIQHSAANNLSEKLTKTKHIPINSKWSETD